MVFLLKRFGHLIVLVLILPMLLTGCTASDVPSGVSTAGSWFATPPPLPTHPLYVIARGVGSDQHNELVMVDADTWQVSRRTRLLNAFPWGMSQDPLGRIWIGYGAGPGTQRNVQIVSPDGKLFDTLTLDDCSDPELPAQFANGYAFIPCLQTGFYAMVIVMALDSLEEVKRVDVRANVEGDDFLLLAVSGSEKELAIVGNGRLSNRIVLMDTQTFELSEPYLLPASNFWTVLPYQGKFLLLNTYIEGPDDLVLFDPTEQSPITFQHLAARTPVWGALDGDTLYAYHNAQWSNSNSRDMSRSISRTDLETGESELWPLPDGWPGQDLVFVNGKIILAASGSYDATEGLYEFDPKTGSLVQVMELWGAFRLLAPGE